MNKPYSHGDTVLVNAPGMTYPIRTTIVGNQKNGTYKVFALDGRVDAACVTLVYRKEDKASARLAYANAKVTELEEELARWKHKIKQMESAEQKKLNP